MKLILALFVFLGFAPQICLAYIMPTRTILSKTSEKAGSGAYSIDQEVQFANGDETISLRETWIIEDERNMRLTVTGTKELQGQFSLQFLYKNGQKISLQGGSQKTEKVPEDFLERFFNFRKSESFASVLTYFKIIPPNALKKKVYAKAADFKYEAEPWVRYSRAGGVVNYAFGNPTPPNEERGYPGIWIEQDHFVIRKLRLPSQVEIVADNYGEFSRDLFYPRSRTVRWGNNAVNIRLLTVSGKPANVAKLMQPASLNVPNNWNGISGMPVRDVITEFYTRFR